MDSYLNESARKQRFLSYENWLPACYLPEIDFVTMIEDSIVYSPRVLVETMLQARKCLDNYPGNNKQKRRELSEGWLGWWINELSGYEDSGFPFMKTFNIRNFDRMGEEFLKGDLRNYLEGQPVPAAWFVAGLEGHEGHRFALDSILENKRLIPLIIFEREEYMLNKERKKPFLPLEIRMSMFSHYMRKRGNRGLILCNPYTAFVSDQYLNDIYEFIFNQLHAIVCLPNSSDPTGTFMGKVKRSTFLPNEWAIPYLDVPSTTERVLI